MSLARRLELLEWAQQANAFILEDDYDSEYRYRGRPLAASQGLDEEGRVIYIGTMSKVMFPGLRIGYMVVPDDLVDAFRSIRIKIDSHPSAITQAALAEFIEDEFLSAHIRRMRAPYNAQQTVLIEAIRQELDGFLSINPEDAGMHLLAELPTEADDAALSRSARAADVEAPPLSLFYEGPPKRRGLLLDYAGSRDREIRHAAETLGRVLSHA